ncbi:MAG: hypothetical protein ACOVRN_01250 [Flavobacterium sp.]
MEIAVPLIALGGMYIISNQKNEDCAKKEIRKLSQEQFVNMGGRSTKQSETYGNYLPNTNTPPQNFPVPNINQLVDTVDKYPNPNAATDKYFDQNVYQQKERQGIDVGQNPQKIFSLTGDYLDSDQFQHNNMKPFNGGKVKGRTYDMNITESIMDNMVGSGSQVIRKIEQAPLFKPEENMQWAYGMPNQTDFFQSRVNPSMKNNNVKPFDSITVGPGLDQGYGINGSNGYNSGMEARDKWLPKTVDQLRVETNPKLEYQLLGHEGPADSFIKTAATTQMLGRVEKQRPDTFYINTQDRWLTTTGASKGETLRPLQEMGVVRRNDIPIDYMGPAGTIDMKAATAPQNYEPAKRHEAFAGGVGHSIAAGRGDCSDKDNCLRSHTNYENNRSTVKQPETMRSGFSGAIGAVVAPIMDMFRPTRKDETITNVRVYGDAGTSSMVKGPVYNPQDMTPTTIKETTLYAPTFRINNQKESMYVNNYTSPDLTQRDTTSCEHYTAAGGYASAYGSMNYDAAYRQHNNDIKSQTIDNRPNQGGTQIFNQQMHVNCNKSDCDRLDGRLNPAFSRISAMPPSTQTYGSIHAPQYYNESAGCDRISPDLLTAFKSNPYTHSLTSAV